MEIRVTHFHKLRNEIYLDIYLARERKQGRESKRIIEVNSISQLVTILTLISEWSPREMSGAPD